MHSCRLHFLLLLAMTSSLVAYHTPRANKMILLRRVDQKRFKSHAPKSMRNHRHYHYHHFDEPAPPKGMQRRFMWKEMDDTMDDIFEGVATGARAMKQMLTDVFASPPEVVRYKKHVEYVLPEASTKIKFVLKTPPKHMATVGKPIAMAHVRKPPAKEVESFDYEHKPPEDVSGLLDADTLRQLEQSEEKRVEASIYEKPSSEAAEEHDDGGGDIVRGNIKDFDDSWIPVTPNGPMPFSTEKPHAVSQLHTKIESDQPKPEPDSHKYEVTENSAEESINRPQAFQMSKFEEATTSYPMSTWATHVTSSHHPIKLKKPRSKKKISSHPMSSTTATPLRPRIMKMSSKIFRSPATTLSPPATATSASSPVSQLLQLEPNKEEHVMKVNLRSSFKETEKRGSRKHRGAIKYGEKLE